MAGTSETKCFQYACVSLTEFINENALLLVKNLSLFLSNSHFPAVKVPG